MNSNRKPREAAIAFILLTIFIDVLGIGIIIPVLPELVKEFVGGDTQVAAIYVGVIGTAYSLMQFLFAPIIGALSDRFGRRPVLLASLFGLGVDFIVQAVSPNVWWLLGGRLFAGMMGASFTAANAYIADVSTADNRARNFGLSGMMFGLGFIVGPALGGVLGEYSLRVPFFLSAFLALLNWLYGFFILPESLPPEKRSAFSIRKAHPFKTVAQLRQYPIVAGLAVALLCSSLAQRGLENVWVLSSGYRFGWDELTNGLTLGLVGLTAVIVQGGLVRPMIRRIGERRAVLFGMMISSISFIGYGLATEGWMIPYIIIFGSIGGVGGPAIQSIVAGSVNPQDQGKVQGSITSLMSLTSVAAPTLFTTGLFSFFISDAAPIHLPGAPFLLGSALYASSLLIAARVFRRFPAKPPAAPATLVDSDQPDAEHAQAEQSSNL
ncbi:MAG: TCR/Tet family MFS transporter [Planctomycetota bacterium]